MAIHPTLATLERALPPSEFSAVSAWAGTFYPFQADWLLDRRLLAALNKCRQIGGSHTFGAWAALNGLLGEDTVLVSRAEPEAIDLLSVAASHLRALELMGSKWARVTRRRALSLVLDTGAEIRATTSKAAGRGFSGNVVLDEFAYHDDQAKVWDAALAATTHGYSCRICSTPNGVGDYWHQLCTEIGSYGPSSERGWKIYLTTIDDAIAQGMKIDLDDAWARARNDPRIFDQLYRGVFLDGDLQYIPSELIKQATVTTPVDTYAETFGGLDIGESRDRTVLTIIQGDKANGYQVAHCETHARTDDALIQKLIDEAFGAHGCTRLALDATGMGTFPAKQARSKHGPKLEPVIFTNKSKEMMAGQLYQGFAEHTLRLPRDLPNAGEAQGLRDDIASIRRIVTSAGNVRFDAPRTSKGHADRAWALMLAIHATSRAGVVNMYSNMKRIVRA